MSDVQVSRCGVSGKCSWLEMRVVPVSCRRPAAGWWLVTPADMIHHDYLPLFTSRRSYLVCNQLRSFLANAATAFWNPLSKGSAAYLLTSIFGQLMLVFSWKFMILCTISFLTKMSFGYLGTRPDYRLQFSKMSLYGISDTPFELCMP